MVKRTFALNQSYPNPAKGHAAISFALPETRDVTLEVFDMKGRIVRNLFEGSLEAGEHEVSWDIRDNSGNAVSTGVYVYRLTAGNDTAVEKMLVK